MCVFPFGQEGCRRASEEIRVGNGELKQSNRFFCFDPLWVDVLRPASNLLQIKGTPVLELNSNAFMHVDAHACISQICSLQGSDLTRAPLE